MSYSNIEQRKDTKTVVKNLTKDSLQFSFSGQNKVYTKKENCTDNTIFSLSQVVELIKSQTPIEVLQVRKIVKDGFSNNVDSKVIKSQIKPLKNSLPYILMSGTCTRHHSDETLSYNGCVQVDFDFKYIGGDIEAKRVKNDLKNYPSIIFAAISPSGVGVKALIATTNRDLENHTRVANAIILELSNSLNIDAKYFDKLGASQPCFVPFDSDLYYNANYKVVNHFEVLLALSIQDAKTNALQIAARHEKEIASLKKINESAKRRQTNNANDNQDIDISDYYASEFDVLQYLTDEIVRTNTDVTSDRNNWLAIAWSLSSLGENARAYFHKIASLNSTYKASENDKLFDDGTKKGGTFSTFVGICKSNGITTNEFCKQFVIDNAPKHVQPTMETVRAGRLDTTTIHFELKDNEFVGTKLNAKDFKRGLYMIKGGTGTGKSNFAARNFKKTLIISRNVTTLENYNQYGFIQYLSSDSKENFADLEATNYERISVTYASLKKLRNEFDLDTYTIFYDEVHLLNEAFDKVEKETRYTYESIDELQKTNVVVLMSANDVILSGLDANYNAKYTFNKASVIRHLQVVYNASFTLLINTIKSENEQGRKVLLYTNRTETQYISEVLKDSFVTKSVGFFDASKHGKIDLSDLVYDITSVTSAFTTGKDNNNENLSIIMFGLDMSMSASTINQFFGRGRKWESARYYLFFEFKQAKKQYTCNPFLIKKGAITIANATIEASVNDYSFLTENKQRFVRKVADGLEISYFDIDNYIQKRVSQNIITNASNLDNYLKGHNYISTFIDMEDELETVAKDELLVTPSELYILELNEINDNNEGTIEFLTTVKYRFDAIEAIGFNRSDSIDIINIYKSPTKWRTFVNKLIVEQYYKSDTASEFKKLYDVILLAFTEFKTSEQFETTLKRLKLKNGKKTELFRVLGDDKKTLRWILSQLDNYYNIDKKRSNKNKLFKLEKSDFLGELNPRADDLKALFKFSRILKGESIKSVQSSIDKKENAPRIEAIATKNEPNLFG